MDREAKIAKARNHFDKGNRLKDGAGFDEAIEEYLEDEWG